MKILVVDDEPVSRQYLMKILSEFAECESVPNGMQALTAYKKGWEDWAPFDLMTLDVAMPDMDGKKVLQAVRSLENEKKVPKDKKIKILVTSAHADKETIISCAQMGCDDYISKPFDRETILKKINRLGIAIFQQDEKEAEGPASGENREGTRQGISEEDKRKLKENIQRIVHRFRTGKIELPVLPKIVDDVRKVMISPNSTIEDLARVVEKDAVISIRIIAGANSPFYRGTEKIATVDKAIMRLGFKETGSIVNAIANKNLYESNNKNLRRLMEKLWLHSLASAYGAKILARKLHLDNPDTFFLMGLTHDIGMTLLFKHLEGGFFRDDTSKIKDIYPLIQRIHSDFGAAIIKRWGFPDNFARVILQHEGPQFSDDTEKDTLIVNLAKYLAYKLGYGLFDLEVDLSQLDATRLLNLDPDSFDDICAEIKENIIETSEVI